MSSIRVCSCGITPAQEKAITRSEILRLTELRGPDKSICPSEVARKIFPVACWRDHMPFIRETGFQLVKEEQIHICQKGITIPNPEEGKIVGPIRFQIRRI